MRLGVVGGSSLVSFDPTNEFSVIGLEITEDTRFVATTSYGDVKLRKFELSGAGVKHTIFFMQRHSHDGGGITPPHKINHHANMKALYDQKVDCIVATCSVGECHLRRCAAIRPERRERMRERRERGATGHQPRLRPPPSHPAGTIPKNFPPGRVGVACNYIDFTGCVCTYHEDDAKFTSVTKPFDKELNTALLKTLRRVQVRCSQALARDSSAHLSSYFLPVSRVRTPALAEHPRARAARVRPLALHRSALRNGGGGERHISTHGRPYVT